MKNKMITLHTNDTKVSQETASLLTSKLERCGFSIREDFCHDSDLIVCIGGDGAFIEAVHSFGFPTTPFIGINTGHLGFFQEINPDQLDAFIQDYLDGNYRLQPLTTVKACVMTCDRVSQHTGLNEIVIKGSGSYSIHLDISIGKSFIERFSGDGILVATPAGSTAYNYSLGGSIVDPRLKLLQITPIAPMNTTAYRSFTSSILLPSDLSLGIIPECHGGYRIMVSADGVEYPYQDVTRIDISFADTVINLLRLKTYDFWSKVKTKFLDDRLEG